jgi:hypothetical protein
MPGSTGQPDGGGGGGGGGPGAVAGGDPSPRPTPPGAEEAAPRPPPEPDDAAAALRLALDQLSALGLGGSGSLDEEGEATGGGDGTAAGGADGGKAEPASPDGADPVAPLAVAPAVAVAVAPGALPLLEPDVSPPPPPPRPSPPDVFAGFAPHPSALGPPTLLAEQMNVIGSRKKSVNMTECVPVPSSEHVAEIVGRQGEWPPSGASPILGRGLPGPPQPATDTGHTPRGLQPPGRPSFFVQMPAARESWAQRVLLPSCSACRRLCLGFSLQPLSRHPIAGRIPREQGPGNQLPGLDSGSSTPTIDMGRGKLRFEGGVLWRAPPGSGGKWQHKIGASQLSSLGSGLGWGPKGNDRGLLPHAVP